ncbi:interleukin 4, isoform CRA_c [Rattus norvegicus]|uniref:Interleukin-4 n=2 Tax=Rattus norvegicus TaxID=10116 RepID=IL4_RAT|nr:interleukin-4 precursor [Rattus norvegicus]P20096.2 RecName: Full=Interleukin-4; Short=IL-4; AltName: Full=B-cell IGG differentiation factor; AltName: Full=B-cell growth factor 1; AltName: Full=B-cell stimulatory factor 1; Short=BSF-1; AltName: Full=Lymphocyte stimulatory factor 1; Flags: Precursor [Rattus norvegicus]EDM04392.1 interleukin 4, isoform CRA_c [Rattus norvegicus]CAA37256.2 interleukin 4 [Rattus norvegicus]CAC16091.1 interleukin 4 [Rattus norvegicus]|eukprot:NP_958427.1 interleukin-4 precursor [Rattus norvegicus]
MGLSPHLAVTLFCFLICTGNGIHGCNDSPLREIINTLNQVTEKGTPCTEMFVPDVLTATRNTTENELICRASRVLRKFYFPRDVPPCLKNKSGVLGELRKLCRGVSGLNSLRSCTVNESTLTTLKDFLESLKSILRGKYLQSCTSMS